MDFKKQFEDMEPEDKVMTILGLVFAAFMALGLILFIVAFIKEMLIPALIAVAVYAVGMKMFGWPIPKFVKKLFK